MLKTPKGMRLHIGIFGRRNVGKSSLLNAVTRQNVSIVSDHAGTTTDPVEKPIELLPLGPVLFIDTAGLDDEGILGELRNDRTKKVFDRVDLGVIVTEGDTWGEYEKQILSEVQKRSVPVLVVINKTDRCQLTAEVRQQLEQDKLEYAAVSAESGENITDVRRALLKLAPEEYVTTPAILGDLMPAGELCVFVVPIDKEAPKGRLILPQVMSIRDILDNDSYCMVVKERELRAALDRLKTPPRLVVTDSQAFLKVAADTPPEIPMTSFSILFARFKGDLNLQVAGTLAIESLVPGDKILIAESCSHHSIADDIGTVKIPRWLTQYVGGELDFQHVQGHDFDYDLSQYKLVIHCGACMTNRREVLNRILKCQEQGVPVTNYGLTIAYSLGIFERALQPFPAALDIYKSMHGI